MRNQYPLTFFIRLSRIHHIHRICRKISNFSTLIPALCPSQNPFPSINELRYRRHKFSQLLQVSDEHSLYYKSVHGQMVVLGFQSDVFLANILLHSYSKCNCLTNAELVFDRIPGRNLITWSSMISMYTQHGQNEEALWIFSEFQKSSSENPNQFILASVLRACTQSGATDVAIQVHDFVTKAGFDQDVYVGTSLIDFYSKNGEIEAARLVFDDLAVKTPVTWTTIISGYSQSGRSEVSLRLFIQMLKSEVLPDRYVLSSAISACSMLEFLEGGRQIHGYVLRNGTETDVSVINVLIDLYSKCHRVRTARQLFDQMVLKNVVSWTTMIAGYMQNSCDWDAVNLFSEMGQLGWRPDGFACTSILTSCGSTEALEQGKQVHSYTIKANLECGEFVRNSLIDMYAKCNSLEDARRAFNTMPVHNVISYNAMIEGYARQDKVFEALDLFNAMRLKSFQPSLLTFVSILGLSASSSALDLSRQIHGLVIKSGTSLDIYAGSALVDVYSKCFYVDDARLVFEEMNERDIVVWNAMIFGHTQNGQGEEALKLFLDLQFSEMKPNEFTFVGVITAASNLASLLHGQQFHSLLVKSGQYLDPYVSNALLDMYAKCGSIQEAHNMFYTTYQRDVVCWNSMISTYAQHGLAEEALQMFHQMQDEGIKPNYVTFVGLLSACSHGGLVESGLCLFDSMATEFGIQAGTEHYACVVALLGRAGKLHEAKEFIEHMPIEPAAIVWRSLLSACRVVGNVEMGRYAAEMAIAIDPKDSGSYVLLSNIYASKGMWADGEEMRKRMDRNGVLKEAGHSWIEIDSNVHVFIARDKTHGKADLIYSVLDRLILQIKGVGYVLDTATCLLDDYGEYYDLM